MKKQQIIQILSFIIGCLLVGFLSSFFAGNTIAATYATLSKPFFAPPANVFGPAWTILYVLMGISVYLIWQEKENHDISSAIKFFVIQLILNFFWTIIFFRWNNLGFAFYEILVLLVSIGLTIFYFKKISKTAAYLLLPYVLWVLYATILTFSIWNLN
jgi:tryptophan-rich sensory protein